MTPAAVKIANAHRVISTSIATVTAASIAPNTDGALANRVAQTQEKGYAMTPQRKLAVIIADLDDWGISENTARQLAVQYDLDLIAEHITNTARAIELKWVNHPAGWFIASLRGNWGPPRPPHRKWYSKEYETFVIRESMEVYHVCV